MEGMRVVPNPHFASISPFKELWERDKSERKEVALQELTYIELMCSLKKSNPYATYSDDLKPIAVAKAVFKRDYFPDSMVEQCMRVYTELMNNQTPVRLLSASKSAAEKLIMYLQEIDLSERTKGGVAVYKPAEVMRAVAESDKLLAALQSLEKKVQDDFYGATKSRANRTINPFEV